MVIALTHYLLLWPLSAERKREEIKEEGSGELMRCQVKIMWPPSWNTEATWETTRDIISVANFRESVEGQDWDCILCFYYQTDISSDVEILRKCFIFCCFAMIAAWGYGEKIQFVASSVWSSQKISTKWWRAMKLHADFHGTKRMNPYDFH